MHMEQIPWNATAFQVSRADNIVCRATAVIFEDGRVIGNIADGMLRSPTKANQVTYHDKFLRQHLLFAGAACRVVVVQHARAFEDAMSISVRTSWTRWGNRDVLATFDELPRAEMPVHEFTKKGQGLLFEFKQALPAPASTEQQQEHANALHCPNLRERMASYGIFY